LTETDRALAQAWGFTAEDLAANRIGQVTPRQRAVLALYQRGRRRGMILALVLVVGSVLFWLLAMVWGVDTSGPGFRQAWPYLLLTLSIFLAVFGATLAAGMIRTRDVIRLRLSVAQGPAMTTMKTFRRGRFRRVASDYIWVGPVRFVAYTPEQAAALEEGRDYRVFYVRYPPFNIVLSMETLAPGEIKGGQVHITPFDTPHDGEYH
jgi:hypothetical protein